MIYSNNFFTFSFNFDYFNILHLRSANTDLAVARRPRTLVFSLPISSLNLHKYFMLGVRNFEYIGVKVVVFISFIIDGMILIT